MNNLIEIFQSPSFVALGYTLLNSIWQSLIILVIVVCLLRFITPSSSSIRYIVATTGMTLIVISSIGTFIYLLNDTQRLNAGVEIVLRNHFPQQPEITDTSINAYLHAGKDLIQSGLPIFIMIWGLGALIFNLRVIGGLLYIEKLKHESILLNYEWTARIQAIANNLHISRVITLAESSSITSPIVIGFFKPIILIPISMCTCLPATQLETIFIHELMHIRRKDYLINVLQSFVEAIYFFNPFVWVISRIMRSEREHCCDDAVVELRGSAREYVQALASLEEATLSKSGLSLSLAENKNQLLNRIKRIMEKPVRNYSSRERMVPALLVVLGLLCASWISAQTVITKDKLKETNKLTVVSDTIKKDKSRKAKTATKANEKAEETKVKKKETADKSEAVENNDDEFYSGPAPFPDVDFDIPPIPDLAGIVPPLPDFGMDLQFDMPHGPHGAWKDEKNWEEFSKEFETHFKTKFEDFYKAHEKDIEAIMEDVQEKLNNSSNESWETRMQAFSKKQEEWALKHADEWERSAAEFSEKAAENMRRLDGQLKMRHDVFEKNHEQFKKRMEAFEKKNKLFEEELKSELIKDGYLDENEALENMHWHNGSIEINGKKIKPEDEKKYNDLHKKYFEEIHQFD
jgi:bla regulator protein blaR1